MTSDLKVAFEATGQSQISVMRVEGPNISKYGVIAAGVSEGSVTGLVEKPRYEVAPSDMASIGRYILTPDILISYATCLWEPAARFNSPMRLIFKPNRAWSARCHLRRCVLTVARLRDFWPQLLICQPFASSPKHNVKNHMEFKARLY